MGKRIIKDEDVFAAADSIASRGEEPSQNKVKEELNGKLKVKGSPNRIGPLLNEWYSMQESSQQRPKQFLIESLPNEVQLVLNKADQSFATLLGDLSKILSNTVGEIRLQTAKNHAAMLNAALAEAEEKIEEARTEANEARCALERSEEEKKQLKAYIKVLETALSRFEEFADKNNAQFNQLFKIIGRKGGGPRGDEKQPSPSTKIEANKAK